MTGSRFGVVGASPMVVHGLRQALADVNLGSVVAVDLPLSDADLQGVAVYADQYRHVDLLRSIRCRHRDLPLIAVLTSTVLGQAALEAGAWAVTLTSAPAKEIAYIVKSCVDGFPLLPTPLALDMARLSQQAKPSSEEVSLLEGVASGETVRSLASRFGYSERHLHRLLKRLYERLAVKTRVDAVEEAVRRGWLSPNRQW